jgi:SSS family solute:Na+ symporter
MQLGGYDAIKATLDQVFINDKCDLQNINWSVTIIPIWFVGMTLYQEFMPVKVPKKESFWSVEWQ